MPLINSFPPPPPSNGGGSGKLMQQFTLPLSSKYEEFSTGKEWDITEVEGQPNMNHSYYDLDSNMIYAVALGKENESDTSQKTILYMQDVGSGQITKETYPVIQDATLYCPFIHSSGLFMFVYRNVKTRGSDNRSETSNGHLDIYKLNRETQSLTQVNTISVQSATTSSTVSYYTQTYLVCPSALRVKEDRYMLAFIGEARVIYSSGGFTSSGSSQRNGFLGFDITKNELKINIVGSDSKSGSGISVGRYCFLAQQIKNWLYLIVPKLDEKGAAYSRQINVDTWSAYADSIPDSFTPLTSAEVVTAQIGDKLIYVTDGIVLGGKRTGEIDLANKTIDTTKYPEMPSEFYAANYNLQAADGKVLIQANGKTASLELTPSPPQNNPLVLQLFKGDRFNSLYKDIDVVALKDADGTELQPAFSITRQQQTAEQDYEVHLSQYDLKGTSTPITVIKP